MPPWPNQIGIYQQCTECPCWFPAVHPNALTCSGTCRSRRSRNRGGLGPARVPCPSCGLVITKTNLARHVRKFHSEETR